MTCARVELAVRHGIEGSISRNVAPDGWNLVLGDEALTASDPNYLGGRSAPRGRPGHSPRAVRDVLEAVGCSTSSPHDGFGMFCGYLVFDAWIANQDRHDQNWALLQRAVPPGERRIAPSFDHASALGFNLTDAARRRLLDDGLPQWAQRGLAHRFEHDPGRPRSSRPTLVDVAHGALELAGTEVEAHWLDRLTVASSLDVVTRVAVDTPRLSEVAARFAVELLEINRRRLLG